MTQFLDTLPLPLYEDVIITTENKDFCCFKGICEQTEVLYSTSPDISLLRTQVNSLDSEIAFHEATIKSQDSSNQVMGVLRENEGKFSGAPTFISKRSPPARFSKRSFSTSNSLNSDGQISPWINPLNSGVPSSDLHDSFFPTNLRRSRASLENLHNSAPVKLGRASVVKPVYPRFWIRAIRPHNYFPPIALNREGAKVPVWGFLIIDNTQFVFKGDLNAARPAFQNNSSVRLLDRTRHQLVRDLVSTIINLRPGSNEEMRKKLFYLNTDHAYALLDAWQPGRSVDVADLCRNHAIAQFDLINPYPLEGQRESFFKFTTQFF